MLGSSGIGNVPALRRRSMVDREARKTRTTSSMKSTSGVKADGWLSAVRWSGADSQTAGIMTFAAEPLPPYPLAFPAEFAAQAPLICVLRDQNYAPWDERRHGRSLAFGAAVPPKVPAPANREAHRPWCGQPLRLDTPIGPTSEPQPSRRCKGGAFVLPGQIGIPFLVQPS